MLRTLLAPLLAPLLSTLLLGRAEAAMLEQDHQAIIQIEAQRLPVAALDSFARHSDAETRARAARALGRLRSAEAVAPLSALSHDPAAPVRAEAAFALGLTPGSERLLLGVLADEPDPAVRAAAADALGLAGTPASVPALLRALEERARPLHPAPVAAAASRALGRMAARGLPGLDRSDIIRALLDQLDQPDRQCRRDAAFALSRVRARSLSPELQASLVEAALREPDADAQALLVRAVGALGAPTPNAAQARDQDRVFALSSVDPDVGVRVATARAAGPAGWPGVARMIADPSLQVRLEALSAVGQVSSLDRAALLRPIVEAGDDIRDEEELRAVRALRVVEAAAALDALAGTGALASTAPWLDPARPIRIREAAIRHTQHRPTLLRLASDDGDGPVRVAAATRLMELNPPVAEVMPLLGAFDSMVAAVAMEWLVERAGAEAEPAVLAAMRATEEPDLLLSGAKVLIRLYSGEKPTVKSPAPAAKALLPALHASRAAPVRAAGATLAAALGVPAPPAWHHLVSAPLPELSALRTARIRTSQGEVIVELFPDDAPITVWTWAELARAGYFDGMKFHRVIADFVVQGGDPRGDGSGGPGWTLPDELSPQPFTEGVLGMALSGPETGGSQWFVTLSPQRHLDGAYTAFGRVVSGMHVLHSLVPGDLIERVRIDVEASPVGADPRPASSGSAAP